MITTTTKVFGARWIQGYGFERVNVDFGPFPTRQAARGRITKAENQLSDMGGEYYVAATVEARSDGFHAVGQVREIL